MNWRADSGFLGKGFPFPLKMHDGEIEAAASAEKIRQSIYVIVMTHQGERVLQPSFGSLIRDYIFELSDETYMNLLCAEIVGSISRWEHRVSNIEAKVDISLISQGKLIVSVTYIVRATNRPDNLVFPFYLEEGQW